MNYNEPKTICFKLEGPDLRENINLYDAITTLSEFHSIVDKSYCVLTNQHRLSKTEREFFRIQASNFRQGSFLVDLEILITGTQLAFPILGLTNPYTIWEWTRCSFQFIKAMSLARKNGETPQIKTGENSQIIVITGGNNNLILPDARVIELANRTKKNYAKLAGTLQEGRVHSIDIGAETSLNNSISLNLAEKDLFKSPTEILTKPIQFHADIYDFNKEANTGKLRVLPGQSIPEGDYSFTVIGSQDTTKSIQSMLHDGVKVTALEEQKIDPIDGPKLVRFQIIKVQTSG
ncbi:hypothetical protein SAMN05192551_103253 [Tindallia magadiensis]|uniref:Uncharacterized protein n=1 Tax=Tindallia magadiensis TaxID=69895 RepID=A0A1I3DDM6_9FIRM|nr:hypothetical protein [Tindallia magadiensis]SFH84746.1 hypothetical protein SAMN05192551_103253 [Tindallia magadiensis]